MTATTPETIAELRRLLASLPERMHHVHWSGNTKSPGSMELSAWVPGWGRTSLIRPARWGMNGARFQFLNFDTCMMIDGERLVKYEVGDRSVTGVQGKDGSVYREDIESIDHPIASLIVTALNSLPGILADLDAANAKLDRARMFAQANAVSGRALGLALHERGWLDLLIILGGGES